MVDKIGGGLDTGLFLEASLPTGETKRYSMGEANALGFNTSNVNDKMPQYYYYKDAFGNDAYTTDVADLPTSIELDEGTGDIKITAPKAITDSDMFKRVFDEDSLREYSVAYKLNPEYKISIVDKNEETGEEEEKEITIPEYVENLNSSLQNYMTNLRSLHAYKNQLVSQYGDKAKNMSDEQVAMSLRSDGTSIYLPDTIFTVGSFGNRSNNIFSRLRDLRSEDDSISLEDFEKVYDRDNIGRDEMAAIIALIDGALEQSDWSTEDSYTDADGNTVKNRNSATEMAKLLAFKNYILTNNPHSEWWQQMGDTIESFITNAAYGVTRTFANIANMGEAVVTAGNGQIVQNAIEGMDEAMEYFNTNNALVWDAVANAQILGFLGGTALGTIGTASLGKMAATGIGRLSAGLTGKLGGEAAAALGLTEESAKAAAATATTKDIVATVNALASEALAAENVAVGTKIMLASLSLAQKAALATNIAISAISGAASKNIFTEYLFDTIHDAILYDSTTLRHVMTELAKDPSDPNKSDALQYWGEQFLDNAKWWGGVTAIRGAKRFVGKTALGKAANIVLTKYIAKSRAAVGSTVQGMQDNWAGGSVIAKLREQLVEAEAKDPFSPKTNRLKNKIQIEEQNIDVRNQLKALGDVKLNWDGVKLTDESAEEFRQLLTNVKNAENSIDARLRGVSAVEKEMTGVVIDPVTRKPGYVNYTLGAASTKAMSMYYDSAETTAKYGLKASSTTQIGQDATDYIVGSKDLQIKSAIADAKGPDAEKAARDVEVIKQNLQNLSAILPEEVKAKLDELLKSKAYENYYKAQNEYGISKKVLNEDVRSYEANPIWAKNGYMPVIKQHEVNGQWIDAEGKIDRVIDQEMKHFTYGVEPGQHYEDPELTRLSRRRKMAEAVVEKEQKAIYDLRGNTATNVTVISGEETELVARLKNNEKVLQNTIENASRDVFKDPAFLSLYGVQKIKPSRGSGNGDVKVTEQDLPNIVAGMSPADIKQKLIDYELIKNSDGKLTDTVTTENYEEWFNKQPVSVKRYLLQQYAAFGEGVEINAMAISKPYKLEDIKSGKADIPVRINKTANTPIAEPEASIEDAIANVPVSTSKVTKIKVDDKDAGPRSIYVRTDEPNNYNLLEKAIENGGDDFEEGLERAYLSGSMGFAHSGEAREAMKNINDGKEAFYQGVLIAKIKDGLRGVKNVDVNSFVDDFTDIIRMQVDAYVTSVLAQPGAKAALDALVGDTDAAESAAKYLVLQELAKKENLSTAKQMLREDFAKKVYGLGLKGDTERLLFSKMSDFLEETINTEMANAASIAKTIDPSSIDAKSVFDKVKDINKRIEAAKERIGKDYIMYMDENGRKAYAQVDPAFASLYSYRYRMTRGEASAIAKANALMSKAFRYGTTSVNLASFGNQLFRDFGNAILVGGAWDTIKANADNLVEVFGQTIVDQIKMFDPEGYEEKQLKLLAEANGQTIEEAAVSRELMKGSTKAPSTTERELYRNLYKNTKKDNNVLLSGMKNKLQQFVDKYNPEDLLNGKRENYLRNRVYASALNDAMNDGYTLQQARAFAEFAMNNATTNFARRLYHMQAIADSTPYFSAAINGTKSFWRMWTLDPVGISGRIMGGLIIPTMALTGASLVDEKDRVVYENMPEYDKENNLVFVVGGKAMSIPIPQELGSIVSPFRQFVEYLHGSNKNNFWELMMNDLLGLSPVDLQGFSTVDMDALISDPTIFDRVSRGVSRVFSQIAPVPVKSAYMLATGTDPYSGKNLRDVSYMYWNEETGSVEVMTYEQNAFAKWFADLYGDDMSPELAEKIVSGILGTTGANLLGDITALVQTGPDAAVYSVGRNITEQSIKPITVNQYNLVDSIWKRAIRQLTSEKEALLNSDEMKTINNKLSQTKDETQRKKLLAERQDMVDDFQQKVGDTVKRLENEYNGTFDRKKFAAVVSLLNMNSDAGYQSGSLYSTTISSDQFWDGRDAAIRTMEKLGITGTSDMSIFGYLTTDQQGNPAVKYSSPVAIMDMSNQWSNQSDLHLANIKALVSQNNLWDKHNAVNQQIDAIYNKGKLSDSDYDAIDAIYVNWNAEVMAALAPYITKMTPEAAINNSKVLDYLDSLIEVPGDYKKDKYGRYVTNSKLGNGSANQAYIKNYIRNVFQINDSGYTSGKNYSNR